MVVLSLIGFTRQRVFLAIHFCPMDLEQACFKADAGLAGLLAAFVGERFCIQVAELEAYENLGVLVFDSFFQCHDGVFGCGT